MDKNPQIETVVTKLGTIESEYRVFDMEVIAGRECLETEVVQHGQRFRLDFSKVCVLSCRVLLCRFVSWRGVSWVDVA